MTMQQTCIGRGNDITSRMQPLPHIQTAKSLQATICHICKASCSEVMTSRPVSNDVVAQQDKAVR
jgi:hypothetical protein